MAGPISSRPYEWAQVPWAEGRVLTRGAVDGLPVLTWGGADRGQLATVRQLRDLGLRPGGAEPVAVLAFGHRQPGRREVEHARLYAIADAAPKRDATPAQRDAIERALAARRTCRECGDEQDYYLSTVSRMCGPCCETTGFWDHKTGDTGHDPAEPHAEHAAVESGALDESDVDERAAADPDEPAPVAIPTQRATDPPIEQLPIERARHAVAQLSTAAAARALEDTRTATHPGRGEPGADLDTGAQWGRSA